MRFPLKGTRLKEVLHAGKGPVEPLEFVLITTQNLQFKFKNW